MTLKNLCNFGPSRPKVKQRRRSGLLSPLIFDPIKPPEPATVIKTKQEEDDLYHVLIHHEYLRNVLDGPSLKPMIDQMQLKKVNKGDVLIKQNEFNQYLIVAKSGRFEISEDDIAIEVAERGRIFGETAIIHSTKASQTVKALSKGEIWKLDCLIFKYFTAKHHIETRDQIACFLKEVPPLRNTSKVRLYGLCDLLKEKFYPGYSLLVKQGEIVQNFFLITKGTATMVSGGGQIKDKLTRGCFFADFVLEKETVSLKTVLADPPGLHCLILSRKDFLDHFRDLEDFLTRTPNASYCEENLKYADIELEQLTQLKTLGMGGYGKVVLVQNSERKEELFALKLMKKCDIVGQTQIDQVYKEKDLHMSCESDFIVKLYRTFRDTKYLYLLLEPCMGGDLWSLLRRQKHKRFDSEAAKFYAGCVLEALAYLHSRDIVFRDLKPENVMVSSNGYLKLTDFGFAKKILKESYSFVGTVEYVAPEFIQSIAHNKGVDYWAFGILIYELLAGKTPFKNDERNEVKTYKAIITGIDSVIFPDIISPRARNLIKKLCRPLSIMRIGCQKNGILDIQMHPWFSKLNWDLLRRQELEAPIKITLNGPTDARYFDVHREEIDEVHDDYSTWDIDF